MRVFAFLFFLVGSFALLVGLFGPVLPAMQATVFGGLMFVCGCVLAAGSSIVSALRPKAEPPSAETSAEPVVF